MGVRGLTTFIANRSHLYLEKYHLHDTYLVLDGSSVCCQLYVLWTKGNDCFGGDYDQYANIVYKFFNLLKICNVIPLVVFDGGYEKRKLKTVYLRIKNKIENAKKINGVNEGSINIFPLLMWEIFVDIIEKLGVKCVRCDFEGDSEIAVIARNLQCPVLSYDSDFYIFDVHYIPFTTIDLTVVKTKNYTYIPCKIYRVETFLKNYEGLNKEHLPLLAVMLGNDYVKQRRFSMFYRNLKVNKTKGENVQQLRIKQVILWLKNENVENSIKKILGRFKLHKRRKLSRIIEASYHSYTTTNSELFKYLEIEPKKVDKFQINMPNVENMEEPEEEEPEEEILEDEEGYDEIEEEDEEEIESPNTMGFMNGLPKFFIENYRRAIYPAAFVDIIVSNTYYCIQQVENFSDQQSHTISSKLLASLAKILNPKKKVYFVARNEFNHVAKSPVPDCPFTLPTLSEIETMNKEETIKVFSTILEFKLDFLKDFPPNWHLYLIALIYWLKNSKKTIEISNIYSIILCGIILNCCNQFLDLSQNKFKDILTKYNKLKVKTVTEYTVSTSIEDSLNNISYEESVICLKNLINYFKMSEKCKNIVSHYNKLIIHNLAEFQSCFLHLKYLNKLLKFPVNNILISDFYNGTFIYNMTINLKKRNLNNYIKLMLENCPNILRTLEMIYGKVMENVPLKNLTENTQKKRKKKRKEKNVILVDKTIKEMENDDVEYEDVNNKFSLLLKI